MATIIAAHPAPVEITVEDIIAGLQKTSALSEAETNAIRTMIPVKIFKKGSLLLREGQISSTGYFIFKGCVRAWLMKDNEEKTTEFYTEGDALAPYISGKQALPSKQYWECMEDCTVAIFSQETEKKLYGQFPRLESLCRLSTEEDLGQLREKMASFASSTPEERYMALLDQRPWLLDRVPQYHIAGYLGLTPESLSRIRRRIAKKSA